LAILLPLLLQASEVQNIVKYLLPQDLYSKNGSLIRTLFAPSAKYRGEYGYDFAKIFLALERVGIMREAFGNDRHIELVFSSESRPFLIAYLSEMALDKGNVYRYGISTTNFSSRQFVIAYSVTTTPAISFSKMIGFLKRNGVGIRSVRYEGKGWRFHLDLDGAHLDLPKVMESAEFHRLKEALWIDVCGARKISIRSFGRYWHPKVAIYDDNLESLDLYKSYEVTKRLELALPNGACYIKISDIFTPKNIKHGFRVSLE
jgi:hypothetical protein